MDITEGIEYRQIKNHRNYEISKTGKIRNIDTMRICKPYLDANGYYVLKLDNKKYYVHKLVYQAFGKKHCIDHIDMNKLNNDINNLRYVDYSVNSRNTKKKENQTSKYNCVSYYKRYGRWRASLKINYKHIHIGYYDTEVDACNGYNKYIIDKRLPLDIFKLNII